MEYADTDEDRFGAGFTVVGVKLEHSDAVGDGCYIVRFDDVHANSSEFKINERIQFAYRDENGGWKSEYKAGRVLRHCGNGQFMIADDFRTNIPLYQFGRMDLRLDTTAFHDLRANARSIWGDASWLRDTLCESLRPDQFASLCARSPKEQCLGSDPIMEIGRSRQRCEAASVNLNDCRKPVEKKLGSAASL